MKKGNLPIKFEQAVAALEKLCRRLEEGELPLEESLKLFEEGISLVKLCEEQLSVGERKVEMLVKGKRGEERVVDFISEEGEG